VICHPSGFNCAEAVNFGPPDWLPYGTDIANKYRKSAKRLTLSHDALLVTLVTAAPAVAARLGKTRASSMDANVEAKKEESVDAGEGAVKVDQAS
jgi:hypothetical protein